MWERLYLVLIMLFAINVVLVGLNVANDEWLYRMDVLGGQTPEDIYNQQNTFTPNFVNTDDQNLTVTKQEPIATSSFGLTEAYSGFTTTIGLLLGLTFGYSAIFVKIGLPILIVYLFTGIIAMVQIAVLTYLAIQVVAAVRGLLGI